MRALERALPEDAPLQLHVVAMWNELIYLESPVEWLASVADAEPGSVVLVDAGNFTGFDFAFARQRCLRCGHIVALIGIVQHLAGMKNSQVVVAVNNDPSATPGGSVTYTSTVANAGPSTSRLPWKSSLVVLG